MKNTHTCPDCGESKYTTKKTTVETLSDKGLKLSYKRVTNHCNECGYEGDFGNETQENYENALREISTDDFLITLSNVCKGFKNINIERSLNLPIRTINRWLSKEAKPTAATKTLFSLVEVYPFLLEVAESNYDKQQSNDILIRESLKIISYHSPSSFYFYDNENEISFSSGNAVKLIEENLSQDFFYSGLQEKKKVNVG